MAENGSLTNAVFDPCWRCNYSIDDDEMIRCSKCKGTFHISCVERPDQASVWICPRCPKVSSIMKNASSKAKNQEKRPSSNRSKSRTSTSSQNVEYELKILEEQQALLEKQFQERQKEMATKHHKEQLLLSQKMDLLRNSRMSGSSTSSVSSFGANEKVSSWHTVDFTASALHQLQSTTSQQTQPQANVTKVIRRDVPNLFRPATQLRSQAVTFVPSTSQDVINTISQSGLAARHVMGKRLPFFDGDPLKWPGFESQFNRATRICELNNDENLSRLDECLKGNARLAVEELLYLPQNVSLIMELLRKLFGKPEFVVNALISKITGNTRAMQLEQFEEIIAFSTRVSNIVTYMKQATMSDYLWNPLLMQQLIDKIPCQFKIEWANYRSQLEQANLEVFSSWLDEKAMSLTGILCKPPTFGKQKSTRGYVQVHTNAQDSVPKTCPSCDGDCKSVPSCEKFKEMDYSSRWDIVHKKDLCRICLNPHRGRCRSGMKCQAPGCEFKHNTMLHRNQSGEHSKEAESAAIINLHQSNDGPSLLKIVPVRLYGTNQKAVNTFALLDDGSSLTLMESNIADELGLNGPIKPLCLQWTNDKKRTELHSQCVNLSISGDWEGASKFDLWNVHTVRNLSLPQQSLNMDSLRKRFHYLRSVTATSFNNARPTILIGLDHPKFSIASKAKYHGEFDPVAINTRLGWIVFGANSRASANILHICECQQSLQNLDRTVKEFIAVDSLGTRNVLPVSELDKKAIKIMENSLVFDGERYCCDLLWRFEENRLPPSYDMAVKRMECLQKRLKKETGLRELMESQLREYERKGYISKLNDDDVKSFGDMYWYLPIFPVRNPNKPNKLRLVWDAAAGVNNISLNSMLLTGPDLLSSLPGVLMRFREKRFAVAADLMEMFHQIKVSESNQRYQLFLWKSSDEKVTVYSMKVMTFGASCSPFMAQYVKNFHAKKYEKQKPRAVKAIVENHYMDDWLDCFDTEQEASSVANDVKEIYSTGGFHIRNWISNSRLVVNELGEHGDQVKNLCDMTELKTEKILGLWWNVETDCFTFSLKYNKGTSDILQGDSIPTKREMLRIIMSIFDPLGFLAHFIIFAKILMQRTWRAGVGWDEAIPLHVRDDWKCWVQKLNEISSISIKRWYLCPLFQNTTYELHTFVDASEEAYCAVVYLRAVSGNNVTCRLVAAKSRTAPLKSLTIPRLELNAAVLGTRLAKCVSDQQSFNLSRRFYWSDSKTVICWIRSETRDYKQYVSCRVGEILEETSESEWNWISTKQNIADAGTRLIIPELNSEGEWFYGPSFLYQSEDCWPKRVFVTESTTEELRSHILLTQEFHYLVEYTDFSTYKRLRNTYMNTFRHLEIWRIKVARSKEPFPTRFSLVVLKKAEFALIKIVQQEAYGSEIEELRKPNQRVSKSSTIYKKMPYIDDDEILRCRGRIKFSEDALPDTKNPIILPADHHITNLIILHYHMKFKHHNHETVVNELRQKYSIPRLRTQLKKLRKTCQQCKNDNARPSVPEMAQLPPARLKTFIRPFSFVGIDFFGPMMVVIGRRSEKRWGLLVTCLSIRAIHLELVHTLSSDSCILGLRNFMNRRGRPIEIYCDNGTNLKGASRELREELEKVDMENVAYEFLDLAIKWCFNPPAAPHMGGAWERLVRSTKNNIGYITKQKNFKQEFLVSLLIEVENIINSRPLTYIPIDDENSEALTPNHFLLGSSNGNKPIGNFDANGKLLRNNWHTVQKLANLMWKRWIAEGLPELNERKKWFVTDKQEQLKVNDIVLIVDDQSPRCCFPKGRVIDVSIGQDGFVRKASVQTKSGILHRPVAKLARLDVYKNESIPVEPEYCGGEMLRETTNAAPQGIEVAAIHHSLTPSLTEKNP